MNNENEIQVVEDLSVRIISDDGMFNKVNMMADMMAKSSAIPQHLRDDHGACFNVVIQAMQWKMNPFAVAQKTHSIKGNVGYEAQLINAVVNAHAPVEAPLEFEFIGDWDKVIGKFKSETNAQGKSYNKSTVDKEAEKGVGVRAYATIKGEDKPRVVELYMAQCPVRNSTNWANNPQQQLCYMATKTWARRYCPEVILGVYSADEMPKETTKESIISELEENKPQDCINVEAEVIQDITTDQLLNAIAMSVEDVEMYFKTLSGKWGIEKSLEELGQKERGIILSDPAKVQVAINKMKNEL